MVYQDFMSKYEATKEWRDGSKITDNDTFEHLYYPHQTGINKRPFLEKFTFKDIPKLWELLSKEKIDEVAAKVLERLVRKYEKTDGTIDTTLVQEGVINKMAAHIDALAPKW